MAARDGDSARVDGVPRTFLPVRGVGRAAPGVKTLPASKPVVRPFRPVTTGRLPVKPHPLTESRIPRELLSPLQSLLHLRTFIETGTSGANTTRQMAPLFQYVHTIELHEPTYQTAKTRLASLSNVVCWSGDSSLILPKILEDVITPVAFWLDGHYSGPGTGLGLSECPLVPELQAIAKLSLPYVVFIDDARFLLDAPPQPHDPAQWPRLWELLAVCPDGRYWILFADVVITFPDTPLTRAWFVNWQLSEAGQQAQVLVDPRT